MRKLPVISKRNASLFGALVTVGLVLSGCGDQETRPLTTWSPKGEQAATIDTLARWIFYVAGVVFVAVPVVIVVLWVKFRVRGHEEEGIDEPEQIHGNDKLEILWTAIPLVLLMVLAVFNVSVILNLEKSDPKALKVEVVGQQWWWEYRYHFFFYF